MTTSGAIRLAALGDIHYGRASQGALRPTFAEINEHADILVLCGDLTDYGLPEEAHVLRGELAGRPVRPAATWEADVRGWSRGRRRRG